MEIMCEEPGEDRGRKEGVANENKERERERGRDLCIVKPAAIHKWDPWQNKLKPNNPQLTLRIGNNPVPHTHTQTACKYTFTQNHPLDPRQTV